MEISELKEKIIDLVYSRNRPVFDGIENEWWTKNGTPRRRRLIIVYNPRSSKAVFVKEEVIAPLSEIKGLMIGKYEVKPTDVDDNAKRLADFLVDGDIVITAGGDGTATIGLNGVMLSGKIVRFMALPFGNFNDMARTLTKISGMELYPLEAMIDGKHYRYAACYFTIGMFAESTEIFDAEKTRKKLRKGNKGLVFSLLILMKWYFKNKRKQFIPPFKLTSKLKNYNQNGELNIETRVFDEKNMKKTSDYLAVNGVSVAKMMKGDKKYALSQSDFLSTTGKLTNWFRLGVFIFRSVFFRLPAKVSTGDIMAFSKYENNVVEIQAEGEYKKLVSVSEIVIRKAKRPVKIL